MWLTASLKRDGDLILSDFRSYAIAKSYFTPFVSNISVGSSWDDFAYIKNEYQLSSTREWQDFITNLFEMKKTYKKNRNIFKRNKIQYYLRIELFHLYIKKQRKKNISLTSKFPGALPDGKFIPNFEQWKTIESVLKSKNGELTAVKGPPGTGKTSMLQFIIASVFVNSVCNNSINPTLTVICSTNNQAVTNAI